MSVLVEHGGKNKSASKLKAKLDNFTYCPDSDELTLNDLKTSGHYLTKFVREF